MLRDRGLTKALFFTLVIVVLNGCSSTESDALGVDICRIYAEHFNPNYSDTSDLANSLYKVHNTILEEQPDFYKKHHKNIAQSDTGRQYSLMQKVIKYESNESWYCPEAKALYNAFETAPKPDR